MSAGTVLTDERLAFVEALEAFAARECATREQREVLCDAGDDSHSPRLFARVAQLGWIGATIPEAYGGAGGSVVDGCLLLEAIEHGRMPLFGVGVTLITAAAVERFGTEAQRVSVLGSILAGRSKAIAMSEPGAGSDVGSLRTSAQRTADGWRLDGQKTWITAAQHADELLVVCRSDRRAAKHDGLSMFLVPRTPRAWRSARSRRWAGARSTTCSCPMCTWRPTRSSASRAGAASSSWRG
jgi:alkylation response protein AidB-like acyl-CoA dehydrogenase